MLTSIAVALSFAGTVLAAPAAPAADLPYGDIVRVAANTLMVVGRPLAADKGDADVANAIFYRAGDTLYVIDTGATPSFRPFLSKAINHCARSGTSSSSTPTGTRITGGTTRSWPG